MKDLFDEALRAEGITGQLAKLARSIYTQESGGGKNTKTSNAGAVGGMQILGPTFKDVADKGWNIHDPMHNARAGIRYLRQMNKLAGGDPALTAAGYYGGPGGLAKAKKGIAVSDPRNPNAPNTLQYGQQVAARMGGGSHTPGPVPMQVAQTQPVVPPTEQEQLWANFQSQVAPPAMPQENLAYGPAPAPETQAAPIQPQRYSAPTMPQMKVPDFMGQMASMMPKNNQANFNTFGRWKGLA